MDVLIALSTSRNLQADCLGNVLRTPVYPVFSKHCPRSHLHSCGTYNIHKKHSVALQPPVKQAAFHGTFPVNRAYSLRKKTL